MFFFSSRRRHTRSLRDWSSDVCSSDLNLRLAPRERSAGIGEVRQIGAAVLVAPRIFSAVSATSGVFPFCLGRKAIFPAIFFTERFAELHRFEAGDVHHRMIVSSALHSFCLMP